LITITDDQMRQRILQTKEYCVVILRAGPNRYKNDVDRVIWEHGRRNFALREEGVLSIVCPVADGSDVNGIGIFNTSVDKVRQIMDGDPGVQAGIFLYEAHPCRGFPGDRLPV
jgi:hypothetical protein